MTFLRSALRFVDRYITLAGKSCCPGRSWVGLERSIDRRTKDSS